MDTLKSESFIFSVGGKFTKLRKRETFIALTGVDNQKENSLIRP